MISVVVGDWHWTSTEMSASGMRTASDRVALPEWPGLDDLSAASRTNATVTGGVSGTIFAIVFG